MKMVVLKKYDVDPELALEYSEGPTPEPKANEVLVRVQAASLNPIDARIRSGYGRAILSQRASLPLVLGRDFSGTVVKTGKDVKTFTLGDAVFGVVNPFSEQGLKQGSHAEYVCVAESEIVKKPASMEHTEAASLPYVALTTYSALITHTGIKLQDFAAKRVLVHAGAGGVGSYAIQFLKTLGAQVITTCSTSNVDFAYELGADQVIDYTNEDYSIAAKACDLAYDLLGKTQTQPTLDVLKSQPPAPAVVREIELLLQTYLAHAEQADETWRMPQYKQVLLAFDEELSLLIPQASHYISIVGPMMPLTDELGLQAGMVKFVRDTLQIKAMQAKEHGRSFNYAFFEPNPEALNLLAAQLESHKIRAHIAKVFPLHEAAAAHRAIETGRTRGKIIFNLN